MIQSKIIQLTRHPTDNYSSFHLYVIVVIARGHKPQDRRGKKKEEARYRIQAAVPNNNIYVVCMYVCRGEAVSGLGKLSERAVARSRLASIQGRMHSAKAPGSIPAPDFQRPLPLRLLCRSYICVHTFYFPLSFPLSLTPLQFLPSPRSIESLLALSCNTLLLPPVPLIPSSSLFLSAPS